MARVKGGVSTNDSSLKAVVAGVFGAYYHVILHLDRLDGQRFKARPRGKLRIDYREKNTGYNKLRETLLAIGDVVTMERDEKNADTLVITGVEPRRNAIHRASFGRQQCLAANIDGVIVMASILSPDFSLGFVERCLAEIHIAGVEAMLVVNKMDLRKENDSDSETDSILSYYEKIGIPVFRESVRDALSPALAKTLQQGTWLILGQSGTGKSTLLNRVLGKNLQSVGRVSLIDKGRHTTTNPALYFSEEHANLILIDVPGLREFGMHHRDAHEVKVGFKDFQKLDCRFENCLHLKEPGCAVKAAVDAGEIPLFRYRSYMSMLDTVHENFKPRKGDYWRGIKK
ncbi:MAG TPA: ribosome small subunit-dependent GTPase A [Turneriella sp.]|nr:ribosome small subunit-dependent GTPase A [Turneriella sp.]